jgi:leucyl aminopeptidase (aminopeptidase T)
MATDDIGIALQCMLTNNFARQPHEKILFLTDYAPDEYKDRVTPARFELINERANFVHLLYTRAQAIYGDEYVKFFKYPSTLQSGADIPQEAVDAMKESDIFIAITSFSMSHTNGRIQAIQAGTRGASMPGLTPEMFLRDKGPLTVDHPKMAKFGDSIIAEIEKIQNESPNKIAHVKITDAQELTLEFDIASDSENKKGFFRDYGMYYNVGDFGNLPAGEIFIAPLAGTASGTYVVPNPCTKYTCDETSPVVLHFKEGKVDRVEGANHNLIHLLGFDENASKTIDFASRRSLAEFGIGLNNYATKFDSILESEKILGSVHIALGTNIFFQGSIKSDLHIDFVVPGMNLYVNDKLLIKDGIHLIQPKD